MRRLARPEDFDAVYDIYMHEDVVPYLGFDPMSREAFRAVFDELLASWCFYVYEVDGRVRGFYKAARQRGRARHVAFIETLAVAPQARGTGVALEMMRDAIERLRAEGVRRFDLMVEADNPRGIAFYEKLGFVQEGRLRAAYKRSSDPHYTDEIFMGLVLQS